MGLKLLLPPIGYSNWAQHRVGPTCQNAVSRPSPLGFLAASLANADAGAASPRPSSPPATCRRRAPVRASTPPPPLPRSKILPPACFLSPPHAFDSISLPLGATEFKRRKQLNPAKTSSGNTLGGAPLSSQLEAADPAQPPPSVSAQWRPRRSLPPPPPAAGASPHLSPVLVGVERSGFRLPLGRRKS